MNAFVYNGKVVMGGQFVRVSSADRAQVLEVSNHAPWRNPKASFIGVWYVVAPNGVMRKVTL